jgi:hypothetical protein
VISRNDELSSGERRQQRQLKFPEAMVYTSAVCRAPFSLLFGGNERKIGIFGEDMPAVAGSRLHTHDIHGRTDRHQVITNLTFI